MLLAQYGAAAGLTARCRSGCTAKGRSTPPLVLFEAVHGLLLCRDVLVEVGGYARARYRWRFRYRRCGHFDGLIFKAQCLDRRTRTASRQAGRLGVARGRVDGDGSSRRACRARIVRDDARRNLDIRCGGCGRR